MNASNASRCEECYENYFIRKGIIRDITRNF